MARQQGPGGSKSSAGRRGPTGRGTERRPASERGRASAGGRAGRGPSRPAAGQGPREPKPVSPTEAPPKRRKKPPAPRHAVVSLARALSKLGFCSRSQAVTLVRAGKVTVNGAVVRDENLRVDPARDRLKVAGKSVHARKKTYLMLNKPRGAVNTASDELGRVTVHELLPEGLPHLSAVGRLDQDSEGLLLMTNDTKWANAVMAPESHVEKTYHVITDRALTAEELQRAQRGVRTRRGDTLHAKSITALKKTREGHWHEIVLDEGKNRHIRRLLEQLGVGVKRLKRVAIGPLRLGDLQPGTTRPLTLEEVQALGVSDSATAE